ncbi:MAG TPA: c-type cytochrome [Thermoanaerobaculia bacterium]|nr:c-type cytochrome [Thermoanaerobaculia bacterium]
MRLIFLFSFSSLALLAASFALLRLGEQPAHGMQPSPAAAGGAAEPDWTRGSLPAQAAATSQADAAAEPSPEEIQRERARIAARIAGHESEPADAVFKNIKVLRDIPAGRLLAIMEIGYAKSLGVNCAHCHVPYEWERDDKPQKQIAREMVRMSAAINQQYLAKIKGLKSQRPLVNCTTCHRGQVKPALELGPAESNASKASKASD